MHLKNILTLFVTTKRDLCDFSGTLMWHSTQNKQQEKKVFLSVALTEVNFPVGQNLRVWLEPSVKSVSSTFFISDICI